MGCLVVKHIILIWFVASQGPEEVVGRFADWSSGAIVALAALGYWDVSNVRQIARPGQQLPWAPGLEDMAAVY